MGVERAVKVWLVCLQETLAAPDVLLIILEDAASGEQQVVDAPLCTDICYVQSADDVGADSLCLVVLEGKCRNVLVTSQSVIPPKVDKRVTVSMESTASSWHR